MTERLSLRFSNFFWPPSTVIILITYKKDAVLGGGAVKGGSSKVGPTVGPSENAEMRSCETSHFSFGGGVFFAAGE